MKHLDNILTAIANEHLLLPTLEIRHSDSLDFHSVAVWQVKMALNAAYEAGNQSGSERVTTAKLCLTISEDEFDEQFPLVTNHFNPNATWAFGDDGGCLFETYGEELDFVRRQYQRCIWTYMDGDDGQYVGSGIHFVNRIGYLISTVPLPDRLFIEVKLPSSTDDATDVDAHQLLAKRRQVAVIWSIEDVQEKRPDLDENQAWQVLLQCRKVHDCEIGFNWLLIETVADDLFPRPSHD